MTEDDLSEYGTVVCEECDTNIRNDEGFSSLACPECDGDVRPPE